MSPRRFEVWLVPLDPTKGSETRKTRPCVIVSPDELNENLQTVVVAPMTTAIRAYPSRVEVTFAGKTGAVALDQIWTVDRARLCRKLGTLPSGKAREICDVLVEMFAWSG